jgi:hypothetical protein
MIMQIPIRTGISNIKIKKTDQPITEELVVGALHWSIIATID